MAHTITHRPFLPDEAAALRRASRMTADDWAWVAFPVMVLASLGLLLGKLLDAGFVLPRAPQVLAAIGGFAGLGPSLWVYRGFALGRRRTRSAITGTVEVIEVTGATYLTQEEENDEGPIYYLDMGGGKILLLWGQWLFDASLFADSAWHADEQDRDDPFLFPSHFRVHRSAQSGSVLKIELLGAPIRPAGVLPRGSIPLWGQRESEIFEATLTEAGLRAAIA